MNQIVVMNDVAKIKDLNLGKKTVLVGGCFDILHLGHIRFLQAAKKTGDVLMVALESDRHIKEKKNRKPIHNQLQRAEILTTLTMVDYVILLPFLKSDDDYFKVVGTINPNIIAVTEGDTQLENKSRQAKKINAVVRVVLPNVKPFSSSYILKYASISGD